MKVHGNTAIKGFTDTFFESESAGFDPFELLVVECCLDLNGHCHSGLDAWIG